MLLNYYRRQAVAQYAQTCKTKQEDNKMKKLERLFRKIGEADVHVWGYSTINIRPNEEA